MTPAKRRKRSEDQLAPDLFVLIGPQVNWQTKLRILLVSREYAKRMDQTWWREKRINDAMLKCGDKVKRKVIIRNLFKYLHPKIIRLNFETLNLSYLTMIR